MDKSSDVVDKLTPAWARQPEVPPGQKIIKVVADKSLRSEQRTTPLLEQSQPAQAGTRSASAAGLRFREKASASSEQDSVSPDSESEEEDSLNAAIRQQDPAAIEVALLACADLPQRARETPMLLHALAGLGHLTGVHLLVAAGACVNARCGHRRTPLIHAAAGGSVEMIKTLLDHGANAGKRDDAGNTALHVAVLHAQHAPAAALLGRMSQQEIDQPNGKGCSALFEAVLREDAAMTRLLVKGGARVDCRWHQMSSITPLMLAAARGHAEMLHDLLAAGANPDDSAAMAATALFYAVRGGSLACVGALLDAGADINTCDTRYFTPLLCAVALSKADIVHALLRRGAAMTHHASLVRDISYVSCTQEDAELDYEDGPCRRTLGPTQPKRVPQPALLLAVSSGLDDMVKLLLGFGADVNVVDANGDTALTKARKLGHHAIVDRLLAHGARQ